jgi:hypothetical protein
MIAHSLSAAACLSLAVGAVAATVEDFDVDTPTPQYAIAITNSPPGPERFAGGPSGSGKFLRLVSRAPQPPPASSNTITFPITDLIAAHTIVAEFDFRIQPATSRADGFGFTLLNAAHYTTETVEPDHPPFAAEEPGYTGSVGVGFDIYGNAATAGQPADPRRDALRENFSTSVSLHFDGKVIAQVDTLPITDIGNGVWKRARLIVQAGGSPRVTVQLAAAPGAWVTLLQQSVPGLKPYTARAHFGGRCGGETADIDLDNLSVAYLQRGQSAFSFSQSAFPAGEESGAARLTITRLGDVSRAASVLFATNDGEALAGADYTSTTGTLNFAARQTSATVSIPLLDDALTEDPESFTVALSAPASGTVLGAARAAVRLLDDETAAARGRWGDPINVGVTGVHAALLPTGRVLVFDRLANLRVWDPATGASRTPAPPAGHPNLFCSGHAFLPDGSLLVAGGHADHGGVVGSNVHDFFGLETAFRFVASSERWTVLPDMAAGRWYPTLTTLAGGEVLALSGSISHDPVRGVIQNILPEVWQPALRRWHPLTQAEQQQMTLPPPGPQGFDLYPRQFVAPDGRVYKFGLDRETWFLDPSGAGDWSAGPVRTYGLRGYGAAAMYEAGKIFYVGGDNPPTATAEIIDLNAATPEWQATASMAEPRRQLNATALPDGTVFVSGGSRNEGPDADGPADPVLLTELWSPGTGQFTPMAAMTIARLYHSTALLLPDGRVFSTGGGHSAAATSFHNEAEIFSPPYLFRGPRPRITIAPAVLTYGQPFLVQTPDAASISSACLIRLAAVTHSFDQNARRVVLGFTRTSGGVILDAPGRGAVAPPGHYLLFLLNGNGVPSIAPIVQLATESPGGTYRGRISSTPAENAGAGIAEIKLTGGASFTATFVLGGQSHRVSGAFDAFGDFSSTIAGATPFTVGLHLETTPGGQVVTGSITKGGVTGAFTAVRNFTAHTSNPTPAAGRYTVWLPPPADPTLPQGYGCGTLTISAAGSARLVGTAGDGTPFSFGAQLPKSGSWPIYIPLDGGSGSLAGDVFFDETPPDRHLGGQLDWFHSAFATRVELLGSRYTPPAPGVRVLPFANAPHNALFRIIAGQLTPAPADRSLTLTSQNKIESHSTEPFALTITLSSGLFGGKFADPVTGKLTRTFRGAIIQKASFGAGQFIGNAATGAVELLPAP